MGQPFVSVIVPVYNGERYLDSALKSIFRQHYRPIEVIVVDDGSTDRSAEIAQSYEEVHYIYQSNKGPAIARNTGLDAAQGEFIAFLDADDLWLPHKLSVQVQYLIDHPQDGGTVCMIHSFVDKESTFGLQIKKNPLEREKVSLISLVARKTVFKKVGGFDKSYPVADDFDWITRSKDAGISIVILPEVLMHKRVHDRNLSHQTKARRENLLRMLKASIDRKRKQRPGHQ